MAHARRKVFDLAELGRAPLAVEAVRRVDALFAIERGLTGLSATERQARQRQPRSAMPLAALEAWMREARAKLSRNADVARAIDYMLTRWDSFARVLGDGRTDLSNNDAERALRGIAIGLKAWLFTGSDRGGERADVNYSLITIAKLNDVDPRVWLNSCPGTRRPPDPKPPPHHVTRAIRRTDTFSFTFGKVQREAGENRIDDRKIN